MAPILIDFANWLHRMIQFTMEKYNYEGSPYLDGLVRKDTQAFNGRPHRRFNIFAHEKPTNSGLGTCFFSLSQLKYMINVLKYLLFRAYEI